MASILGRECEYVPKVKDIITHKITPAEIEEGVIKRAQI